MDNEILETDYLIVGSGLMGMAFADTLVAESKADVILVDRHARPGGHWNDAYPFVRLHQASSFYGVSSRPLGNEQLITSGPNKGLSELASAAEICSYFDKVMQETLLASGRVRYFPMSDYQGDFEHEHRFVSRVSGKVQGVRVHKKVVDATYTDTQVPSTHAPSFPVAPGVRSVPVNELVGLASAYQRYVIIGAGKTAIDACLWLLDNGAEPDAIRWIKPREAWLQDRAHVQPGAASLGIIESFADTSEAAAQAESVDDLFERLGAAKVLLRIDETVKPTMYRCATISAGELALLRRIKDVVRLGRVQRIDADQIVLERGAVHARPDDLYVCCTAGGVHRRPAVPVFSEARITIQAVRWCAPAFSAALAAHLELTRDDVATKNAFSTPLPYPSRESDWIHIYVGHMIHEFITRSDVELRKWSTRCRMNPAATVAANADRNDPAWQRAFERMQASAPAAVAKLQQLAATLEA